MILLTLLPLYGLIFTAHLARLSKGWKWITLFALAGLSLLMGLLGLGVMVWGSGVLASESTIELGSEITTLWPGVVIVLTALIGLLFLISPVRRFSIQTLRLNMEAESTVHTLALILATWLVGSTLFQFLISSDLSVEALTNGEALSLGAIWELGITFSLFALLGVGLGLKRNLRDTFARLGVTMPTGRQIKITLAAIILLTLWDMLLSLTWAAMFPDSYERISGISEILFSEMMTPLGALSIGLSAGIGEELLFRGALQPRFGLLLTTILFTVGHTQYEISPALFSVFVIGFVLGIIRQRESTTTTIMTHAGYNTLNVFLSSIGSG